MSAHTLVLTLGQPGKFPGGLYATLRRMILNVLPIVLLMAGQAPPQSPPPPNTPAATPAKPAQAPRKLFNEAADAKAQIAAAVAGAADDGIRVLVVWGANDDERSANWPRVQRAPEISVPRFFSDEYKVVYVDVGRADRNLEIASGYGMTLAAGSRPAFRVLDESGQAVGRAAAGDFAGADPVVLDPKKVAAFLTAHQAPPPPDPEPRLKAALGQAKTDGKYVFLWFSAPW